MSTLTDEERGILIGLEYAKSIKLLEECDKVIQMEMWNMAANRLYYALFHATTALFVHDGIEVGSHRGVKAKLGQYYILTGKMAVEHSQFLARMETLRDKADYNIMFVAKESDVIPNISLAEAFIKMIEELVQK